MSDDPRTSASRLTIRNFAHIDKVDLRFGDLTVLVGAQGTGKSLALQWLKVALDGKYLARSLEDAGFVFKDARTIVDLVFGLGMGGAMADDTQVQFDGRPIKAGSLGRLGGDSERVFFIPAQRSMLISDGWAQPFQRLSEEIPVVARLFSQRLFDLFSARGASVLFPADKVLKKVVRDEIDKAIFHSGRVMIEERQHRKRLSLTHGEMELPFMTWTAGQREFTPLLLGLYHLMPSTKLTKRDGVDWVVIEEPEMGLHPQAVSVVMLLLMELLSRGYRVVVSSHSPHLLTAVWMLQQMQSNSARWQLVCKALGLPTTHTLRSVVEKSLSPETQYRTYLLAFDEDNRVNSMNISSLDVDSDDERIAGWGGITGLSGALIDAVADAVNEAAA